MGAGRHLIKQELEHLGAVFDSPSRSIPEKPDPEKALYRRSRVLDTAPAYRQETGYSDGHQPDRIWEWGDPISLLCCRDETASTVVLDANSARERSELKTKVSSN